MSVSLRLVSTEKEFVMRRSFTLSVVLVLVALMLLSGAAIAQEVTTEIAIKDVAIVQTPQDADWALCGWIAGITGGLVTCWAALKKFLKRNHVDMDDPRVIAVLRVAGQVALVGIAFLMLSLAKKLRGESKDEVSNAKFVGGVLSESITFTKWMCAAVITEKVAPNLDPKSLAQSLGAQPETIQMLVDSSKPAGNQRSSDTNARGRQKQTPLGRFKRNLGTQETPPTFSKSWHGGQSDR